MRPEVGRPQSLAAGRPADVRKALQDRLILSGLTLATLPLAVSSVPWIHKALESALELRPCAHTTLEASLNLLWLLLAAAAGICWAAPRSRRRRRLLELVSLVFTLTLLFPVISASDDLVESELINDAGTAQSVAADLKSCKHASAATGQFALPAVSASHLAFFLPSASEFPSAPFRDPNVATPGSASGNHSPPSC